MPAVQQRRDRQPLPGQAVVSDGNSGLGGGLHDRDCDVLAGEQDRPGVVAQPVVVELIVLSMSRRYGADFGFTSYDPAWVAGLNRLVTRLRSTGAAVLVLGPIPDPRTTVPTCLSGHLDDALACSPPPPDAVNDAGIAAEERTAVVFSVWERSGRHSSRRQRGDGGARRAAGSSRRRSSAALLGAARAGCTGYFRGGIVTRASAAAPRCAAARLRERQAYWQRMHFVV